MARSPRILGEYLWYHVFNRGNEKRDIFLSDDDRILFLDTVFAYAEKFTVDIHAYALMPNHFHLLLMTRYANLSDYVRDSQSKFVQDYNELHERVGRLYGGRFKPVVIDTQEYLRELSRYIMLNHVRGRELASAPIRDRLRDLRDYPWSSYRAYVGLEPCRWPLKTDVVLSGFGDTLEEQQRNFARYMKEGLLKEVDPFEKVIQGCILGSEDFAARLLQRKDVQVGKDITAAAKTGRIMAHTLDEVITAVCEVCHADRESIMAAHRYGQTDDARRLLMWAAAKWCRGKMSLREIGRRLGGVTDSGVRNASRRIERQITQDSSIAKHAALLRHRLGGKEVLPEIHDRRWVNMYQRLVAFHEQYGHVRVPRDCTPDLALGAWVARQRLVKKGEACNMTKLSARQVSLLDKLGFRW
jgi:REP element-mobilizing transposase RayT